MTRIVLDEWQKEYISYEGDKVLVAGRQTGKSEAQAYDNANFAANHPGTNALLISKTQRQSQELLIKTLAFLMDFYPNRIGKGEWKPLKNEVWIMPENKKDKTLKPSRVMCLPTGLAGEGIRAYTIHKLSVDEAQGVEDEVYPAVTPMLLTTGGHISLTGTPKGKKGFFWEAYENKLGQFKVFHINSEEVINNRPISESWPEWRKQGALDHLAREKKRMSEKHYAQEYLGIFVEDLEQVFPDELIKKACMLKKFNIAKDPLAKYYLGSDVGRTTDPTTIEVMEEKDNLCKQVENIVGKSWSIPQTTDEIKKQSILWETKKDGIDGAGLGAGVVDLLLMDKQIADKVIDLQNAMRPIEHGKDNNRRKPLLKEQMYLNLLARMQRGEVQLLDDDEIKNSFRSAQMEFSDDRDDLTIFGNDTHIVEGVARAVWLATKDKSLNIWVKWSSHAKTPADFKKRAFG